MENISAGLGEVLLPGLASQKKEVFPRKEGPSSPLHKATQPQPTAANVFLLALLNAQATPTNKPSHITLVDPIKSRPFLAVTSNELQRPRWKTQSSWKESVE